jgi:hypothetical protein
VVVVCSSASGKFVFTSSFVTATGTYPLQVSQCSVAIRLDFLRINAECMEKLGQLVGSIRTFPGNRFELAGAQPDVSGHRGHFFWRAFREFAPQPNCLAVSRDPIGSR